MKVCFETFGCRLNKAEALQMEADYLDRGWTVTEKHSDADLIVVRGCSVTARAQRDCEGLIAHLRRHYPLKQLRVCGCIKDSSETTRRPLLPSSRLAQPPQPSPHVPTRTARAYLKVQDGCSGTCTFCIVPTFRGASSSEDFTSVVDKAKRFVDAGYHEIVVTGCNLSLYASQGKRLPDLLSALAELTADCRIRLGSLEPGPCALETVQALAAHTNICRFLHVPIQSASRRILQGMRRPYTPRDLDTLFEKIAELLPNLGLGCDLMTGFPGEDDLDFTATKGFLKRHAITNAHVFPYSERPGTVASGLPLVIPKSVRSARAHELSSLAGTKRLKFAKSFIGKEVEIVVEDEKKIVGWTGEYLRCEAVGIAPRKSLARIRVTKVKEDLLIGQLVRDER